MDVKPKNVYIELKELSNQVIMKYPFEKNYGSATNIARVNTDQMKIIAMIRNEYERIEKVLNECKELGDKLDLVQYYSKVMIILLEKLNIPSSFCCYLNDKQILSKIFEYYCND
ncbi:uncharacterized protein LOC126894444 [Daktulosphaira vitifoliae]|uniref:uncharacterized protein LOC126894444 n=1 Tax=Daktulosphaira vitifoliae TaxID=58002 RepID=UPI0021AAA60E|nr:uncharacterized protein LOC126894444 [Daktulosphaira vitifoliae]